MEKGKREVGEIVEKYVRERQKRRNRGEGVDFLLFLLFTWLPPHLSILLRVKGKITNIRYKNNLIQYMQILLYAWSKIKFKKNNLFPALFWMINIDV